MIALALRVETAFIKGAACLVSVIFAAEVALDLPGDGRLGLTRNGIVEDSTWDLITILTDLKEVESAAKWT